MRRWLAIAFVVSLVAATSAQTRKPPVRTPAPPPLAPPEKVAPDLTSDAARRRLKTKLSFCDVMTGRDPAEGILIKIPPHRGRSSSPSISTIAIRTGRAGEGQPCMPSHRDAGVDDGQHAD
jgi:hypothetical protein